MRSGPEKEKERQKEKERERERKGWSLRFQRALEGLLGIDW